MSNSQRLRILHVVDSLEIGGLERVVASLAIAQQSEGHQVVVFSINQTTGFRGLLEQAGIRVVVGEKKGTLDMQVLRRLRALARDCDVIHAHNFVPNYYAAAAILGMYRPPVLTGTCHDMGMRLSNRRLRWLYRWSLRRTARVAMVGQQVCDHFVGAGYVSAARASTVLNGVPVGDFASSQIARTGTRGALGISSEALVIGCVGRLVALKNHQILIGLMPALLSQNPQLLLVLAGDGPLAEQLATQARELGVSKQVLFLGAVRDVGALLPAFDIFAQPSHTEGLSVALLEACAAGLAVVATDVGGNSEIVKNGVTGTLVPVNDANSLSSALVALIDDESLRHRLGESALRWVKANASLDALCLAYDRFYRKAMTE